VAGGELMPYIKQEERDKLDGCIEDLVQELEYEFKQWQISKVDGALNYIITKLLLELYTPSYFNYNRAIGVLECVKQEYYRKVVAPYEELKESENGAIE
jgi:hypothetical protein